MFLLEQILLPLTFGGGSVSVCFGDTWGLGGCRSFFWWQEDGGDDGGDGECRSGTLCGIFWWQVMGPTQSTYRESVVRGGTKTMQIVASTYSQQKPTKCRQNCQCCQWIASIILYCKITMIVRSGWNPLSKMYSCWSQVSLTSMSLSIQCQM